jgi:hypothetical protein
MKIPAAIEENLDEKLMLKRQLAGLLPVEKCYVSGMGQYWYNISGKQGLDAYCRINGIDRAFFERLVLRFCEQVERLEWNLMDINCLVLDPELIFVNHNGEEIAFTVYPQNKGDLYPELQQLMEFLLTKLNHGNPEVVKEAYAIYEMTLAEGFSVSEMKEHILSSRMQKVAKDVPVSATLMAELKTGEREDDADLSQEIHEVHGYGQTVEACVEKALHFVDLKMERLYDKVGKILEKTPFELRKEILKPKEPEVEVVLPEQELVSMEPVRLLTEPTIHPTVCIEANTRLQKGVLICDCPDEYPDIVLGKEEKVIGKSRKSGCCIPRDTISQNHARIECRDGRYYIEDMNSTNGTYINEEPLPYKEVRMLHPGDQLRFADVSYHFY